MTTQHVLLTTHGKAAHAGLAPEEGVSAILEMAYAIPGVLQLRRAGWQISVEAVQGGVRPNVVAPECAAWIRLEAASAGDLEAFCAALRALPPVLPGASRRIKLATAAPQPLAAHRPAAAPFTGAAATRSAGARRPRSVAAALAPRAAFPPSSGAADQISAYLTGRQPEMLALLTELARLETPSSQPETQRAAFDLLARALAAAGYDSIWWPGTTSGGLLLAHLHARARGAPLQLLLGHCDTVWPVGTLATMPLKAQDGRLSGPGVFDMKGGLVQAVFALRALSELGLQPPATPLLLVNSDEEAGSGESTRAIERLAHIACRAFVLEPALGPAGKLKTARKGVGQFRLSLTASQSARDALTAELARLIRALFDLNDPQRAVTVNVGLAAAGGALSGPLTESELVVDVRVPNAGATRDIERAMDALSSGDPAVSLTIEGRVARPPLERTGRNQSLWRTAQRLGDELGLALEEGSAGGGSDGNTTSRFTATLDGLGAVGDGAHALHEHVVVDELPRRAALLALLLLSPVAAP